MATTSQIQKIQKFLSTAKAASGVTVAQISGSTKVPKGNILPHIAMLRKRLGQDAIVTERRDLPKNGGRKVYFIADPKKIVPAAEVPAKKTVKAAKKAA